MNLREATRADDEGIRATIQAAFPDNPKQRAEITAWQYWSNPFGRTVAYVWEDEGRIVATYTAFPMPAVVDGKPGLVANGVDAAVDPEYQGRRLFSPLAAALYEGAANAGMSMTLCFINNPLAIKGTTRAGWLDVGRLAVWVGAVDDRWLARRLHVPKPLASLARRALFRYGRGPTAQPSDTVPRGIDDLWARSGGVTTGVSRDQAWWDWRYGGHPEHPYRYLTISTGDFLHAAAVTTVREAFGGRFVYILELLADTPADAAAIVRGAVAVARDEQAAGVALLALPTSRLARRALEGGLRRVPKRLDPKPTMFGAVPNTPQWSGLRGFDWSVSWGDLDHL